MGGAGQLHTHRVLMGELVVPRLGLHDFLWVCTLQC